MLGKKRIKLLKTPKPAPAYDRQKEGHGVLRRTTVIMVFFGVLLFLPLFARLFKLMILDHDKYESQAIDVQTRSAVVPADRGTIYDCNMNILAASKTVEDVFIDPLEIHNQKEDVDFIAENLARILNVDADSIRSKAAKLDRRYEVVAYKQEPEQAAAVREFINENDLVGIHLETNSKRYYPSGTTAAQVLGFTNAENRGGEGLEAYYDDVLQGTAGAVITTKGNHEIEMLFSYEKYYEATDGNSLVLTLDSTVQMYLEKNLKAAIEKYDVQNGAFAIMMDVNTGAILGMAIEGSYDPNNYLEIIDLSVLEELEELSSELSRLSKDSDEYAALAKQYNELQTLARLQQWRNRCVSDGYEPGSTFKTITLAAALEEGAVSLDTTFYCSGEKDYKDRDSTLHCWKEEGHGYEKLAQALQNSCNIAFADIGILLGGDKLYDYIDALGLLEKTGVDMAGEATGVFHTRAKLMENAQLTTVAFGQSVKPTPIQMVRAIAAVVNGGYVLKPYVVSEILDENGNVIQKNGKTVIRQAISAETSKLMCSLMESVVNEGTAGNAKLPGFHVGGKTGTSEKLDVFVNGVQTQDRIVSFVGVAPMTDPQYICLVALDTPSRSSGFYVSGGVMAAPVVRDIFADTLLYLGVQPDYRDVDMSTVNIQMPDVRDLEEAEAAELLKEQSLSYTTVGSGETVTGQIPAPGEALPGNSKVILYLGEEVPTDKVTVPDLRNLSPAQARSRMENSGLYLQTKGSYQYYSVVTDQDYEPGAEVPRGTTVTVELTDQTALD
ncbi:MAG: PASTA domain-containing protein [Oscillospiraceae bacterium]|nr:PASTA domain-containing protein [Oscillospiraceae bacterium]MBQ6160262.1 PASTA domain-containing protein [Oscillospiraceae bacterium]